LAEFDDNQTPGFDKLKRASDAIEIPLELIEFVDYDRVFASLRSMSFYSDCPK